jgi:phosphopantothenoylcysteine decarboxylase/phosphopantothenate--cysteine ligase
MWEPQPIAEAVLAALRPAPQLLAGVRAVVTAGPTREPLDPVRFISNRSSGKQGYAMAAALSALGAEVHLLSGPTHLPCPQGVQRSQIETAAELLAASLEAARTADVFVGAAAVADYRAAAVAHEKIKKRDAELTLHLLKNPDILLELRAAYPKLFMVGFAAETEALAEHARGKLHRKGLQMIAANWVGNGRAFDAEDNALSVFTATAQQEIPHGPKTEVARALALLIAQHYSAAKLPT